MILTINYIVKYMYHGIFEEHFVVPYKKKISPVL